VQSVPDMDHGQLVMACWIFGTIFTVLLIGIFGLRKRQTEEDGLPAWKAHENSIERRWRN